MMQLQALSAYPLFCAWVSFRVPGSKITDVGWLIIYIIYVSILIIFPLNEILVNQLPPVSRVIITVEQVNQNELPAVIFRRANWKLFNNQLLYLPYRDLMAN